MKTLISLITLVAIVFAYIFSASLYTQGDFVASYVLVIGSIASVIFWINSFGLRHAPVRK